jgi:hypothetical protein
MATRHLSSFRFSPRGLLLAALALALAWALAGVPAAQAAFSSCRSDPIFVLSDGTILDVSVAIGTDVKSVDEIHYVVHGPRGVKLVTALATPTLGFEGLETVSYVDDLAARQYATDTVVYTALDNVSATAYTVFAGNNLGLLQLRLTAQYHAIEGWAGQHLVAYLSK